MGSPNPVFGEKIHKTLDGIILPNLDFEQDRVMSVNETVLKQLEKYSGTDQVRKDLNIDLFGEKLLDSLATIELILALSEELGVELSPGEIDRDMWATPQKIIDYLTERVKA